MENAIYHGIKNKRGRGHIKVEAHLVKNDTDKDAMSFSVQDDGIGFTPEKLEQVTKEMSSTGNAESLSSTYGLYNVNKRLILYYNNKTDGLHIASEYGKGSIVSFTVPCITK